MPTHSSKPLELIQTGCLKRFFTFRNEARYLVYFYKKTRSKNHGTNENKICYSVLIMFALLISVDLFRIAVTVVVIVCILSSLSELFLLLGSSRLGLVIVFIIAVFILIVAVLLNVCI